MNLDQFQPIRRIQFPRNGEHEDILVLALDKKPIWLRMPLLSDNVAKTCFSHQALTDPFSIDIIVAVFLIIHRQSRIVRGVKLTRWLARV